MAEKPIIVYFRNDLRLGDHPALSAAVASGRPVLPLFIADDNAPGPWRRGGASRWWLHHSLAALGADLEQSGTPLTIRRGDTAQEIVRVAHDVGADTVHMSRCYEPWSRQLEHSLKDQLSADGITLNRFAGHLLSEPDLIATKTGGPYKVYTPFWRQMSTLAIRRPVPAPCKIRPTLNVPDGPTLDELDLRPKKPDWAHSFRPIWQPGERSARHRLNAFLEFDIARYHERRDRPDLPATSLLSPHLAFGEISPAHCWHAAQMHAARNPAGANGAEVFMKELAWREFSYHLLFHFEDLPTQPYRPEFQHFPWAEDGAESVVTAWQRGQTGYPIVDAGMRQLWTTGWMHNRVRMITASFLIKDLLIPWQRGEAWFWDTLVDADLASNAASWQWVAGSGADAAPYFRIFNPVTQGRKFDPDGAYIRRYVPELSSLPTKHIHAPWLAPAEVLAASGIRLGVTYPVPIVEHAGARARALAAYATLKAN